MNAGTEPFMLSSLVWIDSGVVVSQHRLESFFLEIKCNGMTSFMEFMFAVWQEIDFHGTLTWEQQTDTLSQTNVD